MCEPITLGILAGMGVATSIAGGVMGAKAQSDAGEAQGQVADRNALMAGEAAKDAEYRGGQEAGKVRMRGSQAVASAKVAAATSGIDTSSGSAADVFANTRAISELDANTIKANAAREAWGYRQQGSQFSMQGQLARTAGARSSEGALLTGLGGAAGSAYQYFNGVKK